MMEAQQSLIDAGRPRTIRKTRDDKGKKRKVAVAVREQSLQWYAGLTPSERMRFKEDLKLVELIVSPIEASPIQIVAS